MPVMRVLILGSGAREHALAWRLRRDPDLTDLICAPGNPGMAALARVCPVSLDDPVAVLALAERERIDLTVVGPEAPLDRGLADVFGRTGRALLGPSRAAAQLECSKAFSKRFMVAHGIPTARFVVCETLGSALEAVDGPRFGFPVVVKADGLAAGKGVVIAANREEAVRAVRAAMVDRQFGPAGSRVIVEECLTGPEVSFFALCDGTSAVPLGSAQDHKRVFDNDRGPNTGGMGAFAPSPLVTPELSDVVMRDVVARVLEGLLGERERYVGFLYVSLMLTPDGPRVIEFNVRFGDPEAQVVIPSLKGAVAAAFHAAATGHVLDAPMAMDGHCAVGVVLASRGYPGAFDAGKIITGVDRAAALADTLVFHGGTRQVGGELHSAGGRVLTVVGRGTTFADAMTRAYAGVSCITFDGMHYRRDIGARALAAGC
jgi:phosphoribosylamine--glycine ligase